MSEPVALKWRPLRIEDGTIPDRNHGYGYDGATSIACVRPTQDVTGQGSWVWSLQCAGAIIDIERPKEDRGREHSKEAAKAAAEAAYAQLLSLHPHNREAVLGHGAAVVSRLDAFNSGAAARRLAGERER